MSAFPGIFFLRTFHHGLAWVSHSRICDSELQVCTNWRAFGYPCTLNYTYLHIDLLHSQTVHVWFHQGAQHNQCMIESGHPKTVPRTLAKRLKGAQRLWWVIWCPQRLWSIYAIRTPGRSRRSQRPPWYVPWPLTVSERGKKVTFREWQLCDKHFTKSSHFFFKVTLWARHTDPTLELRRRKLKEFRKFSHGCLTGELKSWSSLLPQRWDLNPGLHNSKSS